MTYISQNGGGGVIKKEEKKRGCHAWGGRVKRVFPVRVK